MAFPQRSTAILRFDLPEHDSDETLALDVERDYRFSLEIDGKLRGGGWFRSPLGDERWSKVVRALHSATTDGELERRKYNQTILPAGSELLKALTTPSSELRAFLEPVAKSRRLVIASDRPEIHQLPWEAMVDFERERRILAQDDISIVRHLLEGFDYDADVAGDALKIFALAGPNTPGGSLEVLESTPDEGLRRRLHRVTIRADSEKELSGARFDELGASIVTVEAHGDPHTSEFSVVEGWAAKPETLSKRVGKRLMVLLWSCYSAKVQSWGASPALHFQRQASNFVLAFSTPLRHTSCFEIAKNFFEHIFRARETLDPETAVVRERQRLYRNEPMSCDWVSMTLWLHRPVDLSPATEYGPRLPQECWCSAKRNSKAGPELEQAFERVTPGESIRLDPATFEIPISVGIVDRFRGAVVHLSGLSSIAGLQLVQQPASAHPGDYFLALLDTLASYEQSLLIWSQIDDPEVQLVEKLVHPPQNVAVVLIAPRDLAGRRPEHEAFSAQGLDELVEASQYDAAARDWKKLAGQVKNWPEPDQVLYLQAGYWALVRLGDQEKGLQCIERLQSIAPFEAELLRANLEHRNGCNDRARKAYERARQEGASEENSRDMARVTLGLGYLEYELGNREQAERLYRQSLSQFEAAPIDPDKLDPQWSSALGRCLRDYAQLLTELPGRGAEAEPLLQRALTIHALDRRWSQVATSLRTRGSLAMSRDRWDEAEADFHTAARVLLDSGNRVGWIEAVRDLAALAERRGHIDQACAILAAVYSRIEGAEAHKIQRGALALHMAQLQWQSGRIEDVASWCREARDGLEGARPRESEKARALLSTVESLLDKGP